MMHSRLPLSRRPELRFESGVTLIELVISIAVIAIALGSMLSALGFLNGNSATGLTQTRQISVAQWYLDEILAKHYDDSTGPGGVPASTAPCSVSGPESGEIRATYDDVDDYHNLNEVPAFTNGPMSNTPFYSQYRVKVKVACVNSLFSGASHQMKRVTVTVSAPSQSDVTLAVYKGNF